MDRLTGKVALVTGGAGGIGIAAARRFVNEGARVMLVDLEQQALEQAMTGLGEAVACFAADITRSDQVAAAVRATQDRFGGLDIVLANAGTEGEVKPLTEQDEAVFDRVMAVNVKGAWLTLKHTLPVLAARGGGSVIITSSVAGIGGSPGVAPYVTSKHAVIGLMRSAALEVAGQRIRVNTVNPSPTETRMMRSLEDGFFPGDGQAAHNQIAQTIPLGEYGQPEDVANLMCFLASDEARFLTGGVYMVDGGISAR